jgi:hypothetical protein
MNTTPENAGKSFDEETLEKESFGNKTKKSTEEDSNDMKVDVPESFDVEAEHEREVQEEDRFLEKLAIRGVGWRRMKYLLSALGVTITIITRFFLVLKG